MTFRSIARRCALCGIHPQNQAGIRVHSYTLLRSARLTEGADRGKTRTRSYGQLPLCDRCIREQERGATGARAETVAV